eukprot:TRINITY_DN11453_c0_g2_i2.p3 TRINITY_DN11453_c0_g2~~TRINITY_DN11453_c0_g2_i2.p3  ORF type:complete len:234 (+),score=-8.41 TRINITY_DN11453_c0_g2_i2:2081-2782(+)
MNYIDNNNGSKILQFNSRFHTNQQLVMVYIFQVNDKVLYQIHISNSHNTLYLTTSGKIQRYRARLFVRGCDRVQVSPCMRIFFFLRLVPVVCVGANYGFGILKGLPAPQCVGVLLRLNFVNMSGTSVLVNNIVENIEVNISLIKLMISSKFITFLFLQFLNATQLLVKILTTISITNVQSTYQLYQCIVVTQFRLLRIQKFRNTSTIIRLVEVCYMFSLQFVQKLYYVQFVLI